MTTYVMRHRRTRWRSHDPPTRHPGSRMRSRSGPVTGRRSKHVRARSVFDSRLVERYIYEFTNGERKRRNMPALMRVDAIDSIARGHSQDMSNRRYFSHTTPEGLDPTGRSNRAGYTCSKRFHIGLGENIHRFHTYSSYRMRGATKSYNWLKSEEHLARKIVDSWMKSPGHRQNILRPQYDRIGVGVEINSAEDVYATQNFC